MNEIEIKNEPLSSENCVYCKQYVSYLHQRKICKLNRSESFFEEDFEDSEKNESKKTELGFQKTNLIKGEYFKI